MDNKFFHVEWVDGKHQHFVMDDVYEKLHANLFITHPNCKSFSSYGVGKVPLVELPAAVIEEVRSTLKAYNTCSVLHEHQQFRVSVGDYIKSHYHWDYMVLGRYLASDVYTSEERHQNYKECFG